MEPSWLIVSKLLILLEAGPDLNRGPTDYEFTPAENTTHQEDTSPNKTDRKE